MKASLLKDIVPPISALHQTVDKLLLINLRRRSDRLLSVSWRCYLAGLQPTIVEAIEERSGERSYLRTWQRILKIALSSPWQRTAVFDDDVYFHHDFEQKWLQWQKKGLEWRLLYLGASQHHWDFVDLGPEHERSWYYPIRTDGSFAVLLDRYLWARALELIEGILNSSRPSGPLDSAVLRLLVAENEGYCYVLSPNLVIADVGDSDIRGPRERQGGGKSCHWHYPDYQSGRWGLGRGRGLERLRLAPEAWGKVPLISVIMPVYNRAETVALALESLLAQSYPEIEILVVDDHSTDNTRAIVEEIVATTPWRWPLWTGRIIVVSTNEEGERRGKGCYAARNRGLALANGAYLAFQDSDDWSGPTRLAELALACWRERTPWSQCLILRTHLRGEAWKAGRGLPWSQWRQIIVKKRVHHNEGRAAVNTGGASGGVENEGYCCRAITGMVTGLFHRQLFTQLGNFCLWLAGADAEWAERLLTAFDHSWSEGVGGEEKNVVPYLDRCPAVIEGIYCRLEKVLYFCQEPGEDSLSQQYSQEDRHNWSCCGESNGQLLELA